MYLILLITLNRLNSTPNIFKIYYTAFKCIYILLDKVLAIKFVRKLQRGGLKESISYEYDHDHTTDIYGFLLLTLCIVNHMRCIDSLVMLCHVCLSHKCGNNAS